MLINPTAPTIENVHLVKNILCTAAQLPNAPWTQNNQTTPSPFLHAPINQISEEKEYDLMHALIVQPLHGLILYM
jgi:hypothetical protein